MTETRPTVAVVGASRSRRKYGNKAVRAYRQQGWDVYPVNPQADEIEGLKAWPKLSAVPVERLDRISVYLPPEFGLELLDEIAAAGAGEVWFNPGSESGELVEQARRLGLEPIVACSIVDIGESPAGFPG